MYSRHEQALVLASTSHVEVSIASVCKNVWWERGTAKLFVGFTVLSGVFAKGVIAVAVSR